MQSSTPPLQDQNSPSLTNEFSLGQPNTDEQISEIQKLTWAVLDDMATNDQFDRMEQLLLSSPTNRQEFLEVIQMHASLLEHFRDPADRGE